MKEWSACSAITLLQVIIVFGLKAWIAPSATFWSSQPYLLQLGWVLAVIRLNQYFLVDRRWGLDMEERFRHLDRATKTREATRGYLIIGTILLFFVATLVFVPHR